MVDKFTKIVATIGPASESEEIMGKLIEVGMDVARFNTKHSSPAWHQERIARMRKVAQEKGASVGILLDLQGPEIRINLPEGKAFDLEEGEECIFTFDETMGGAKIVLVPQNVVETLVVGNLVLLADGACELEAVDKRDNCVVLKALSECRVENRKTMNIPGVTVDMPSLVEADYQQLDGASASELIDFVGISFVRDRQDIKFLRQELDKRNIKAQIIAKIESKAALDNLREIVSESDGVMVARGDLGVEMPYEELTYWQKMIIDLCHEKAKPVITATQMLKSMTENPRPTRAEVSDVAHAIYDGTDAIMLSEETTVGKYPVKAVAVQARIARFNEPYANCDLDLMTTQDNGEAMANMAVQLTEISGMKVDKIVNLTSSGRSTRFLARLHPSLPILAVTDSKNTFYELSLVYGVRPILISKDEVADLSLVLARIKQDGLVQAGDKLVVTYGVPNKIGGTRTVTIIDV